jgi:subtilase family serine protease
MVRKLGSFSLVVFAVLTAVSSVNAQVESGQHARPRITQSVDDMNRVPLEGNTHPEARPANDRGVVANDFAMEHMLLQLKRSPQQEQAVQQFIDELQTKGSPNYHHWLTAQEFGERFGPAKPDLDAVSGWLESHGFRVNVVYPSGMLIDFSGTAAQVRGAFQTEIHHLQVKGEKHIGNISDPRIPAALAPVVIGIVSLHDFRPHAMHKMHQPRPQFTFPDSFGGSAYAMVPADLAKVYNLNPLFSAGISGQGQTIALIEDTDVFTASDWSTFRQTFGLSGYTSASFTQIHPPAPASLPANNCAAPGVIAPNDAEAILDAEWASASAPSAAVEMAACADTSTTFGGLIAIQNLINATTPPPSIMSISYGQCETVNGAAANAAYNSAYQQAVAEGVSVFVAAGDSGAAGCDNSVAEATHGIGVNAFASTPNNVAVGGTDFSDTYSGTNATYWNSSNTSAFGSAISYIPEIPWNDSCAGALVSAYEGYSPTYGSTSLCNDPLFGSLLQTTVAGGGGPSQCASGAPSTAGVVSGSCQGWPKPSWQSVLGNPGDGVRDTPDVSLFAADGLWSHFYVFCWSDTANGGAACGTDPSAWSGAGGTSFASPIMAGIQALKSRIRLLPACRCRVRFERQQFVQLEQRQCREYQLHFLRRDFR